MEKYIVFRNYDIDYIIKYLEGNLQPSQMRELDLLLLKKPAYRSSVRGLLKMYNNCDKDIVKLKSFLDKKRDKQTSKTGNNSNHISKIISLIKPFLKAASIILVFTYLGFKMSGLVSNLNTEKTALLNPYSEDSPRGEELYKKGTIGYIYHNADDWDSRYTYLSAKQMQIDNVKEKYFWYSSVIGFKNSDEEHLKDAITFFEKEISNKKIKSGKFKLDLNSNIEHLLFAYKRTKEIDKMKKLLERLLKNEFISKEEKMAFEKNFIKK